MESHEDQRVDPHPWRAAVLLGLVSIALGMAFTMLLMPAITHSRGWWVVGEWWPPLMASRFAANGALGYLYSADPFFVAGPLGPIVLIPVISLGDALHLTDNYRYNVPHPSMWLIYGPYALGLGVTLLYAARALAHRVWIDERLASRAIRPWHLWTQLAMVALVLVPVAIVYGHVEDVLALAGVLLGIRSMVSGRFWTAGLWFSLAIGMKQWAILGVPILIAAAPSGTRIRTLFRALLLPGTLMAFTLAVDWSHAAAALLNPRSFPQLGHAALWVPHSAGTVIRSPERWGTFVSAVSLGWWLRGRTQTRLMLAAFGIAFLSRLVFEPVVHAYYLSPALALLFLHERVAGRSGLRTATGGVALLLFFLVHPNPWLWWTVTAAIALWLAAPAMGDVVRRERRPKPGPQVPRAELSKDLTHVGT